MPKYFKRGVKREHHFLKGLEKPLEEIASIPGVKKVIPGRIYASDSRGFEIKVTRETHAGLKLVAKSDGSVQEVFLVVDREQREFVWKKIDELAEEWKKN
ncbi:hypothetical protein GBV73_10935 [Thermococcus sp. 101 C5]|jgi:hypothetical protein|uniref:DUF2103 domain-containing protein n=1 Tax=Thermococcus TaxID=2263 RepID=UPI00128B5442|nr:MULTISPECIES: DUF2103 domain-containing protein [Thermococcus]MCA6213703.1 hypothetical protein [Thermococcus bergensis]MPW40154.1 hypothetical protein [Thermococcus sp. 101 C5]